MNVVGAVPWVALKEASLKLKFSVGSKLCLVTLNIPKGGRVQEICHRLYNEENIPEYLHSIITDCVIQALELDLQSPVFASEDILDVGLMIEQARLLSRQYDLTTCISEEMSNSQSEDAGSSLGRPTNSNKTTFSPSYSTTVVDSNTSSQSIESDAQKFISSSFARGGRTAQQSAQLAKMYHFLVAGDHSVTPSSPTSPTQRPDSNLSLIDAPAPYKRDNSSFDVLQPTILENSMLIPTEIGTNPENNSRPSLNDLVFESEPKLVFRTKKQPSASELLLLNDTTNEFREMIIQLEKSLSSSMIQLTQARDNAIIALQEKHAREMDRVTQGGQLDRIPLLVERHLEEMEGLEAKWTVELHEARKRQRHEYYSFCCDLFKNRQRYLDDKRAMGPQQVALLRQQHAQQLEALNQSKPSFASSAGWTSLIFGKSAGLMTGGSSAQEKVIRVSANNSSLMMARESNHGEDGLYSIVVMLGSQLKMPFEVQVFNGGGMLSPGNIGDVSSLTPTTVFAASNPPNNTNERLNETGNSIYSSSLSAIVLLVDPGMTCSSPTYQEFFKLTYKSTELHFEASRDQIENIRQQALPQQQNNSNDSNVPFTPNVNNSANQNKLQPGDFFVTTHSNLGNIQVVFHMVAERQNVASSWTQLIAGLKNILTIASHYDITTLSLPVLLVENEFRHLYSDGQGIKRAEEVIRTIRSFLVLNSASGTSLKTIRLVCPPSNVPVSTDDPGYLSDAQYFEKIKHLVSTIFNQAIN